MSEENVELVRSVLRPFGDIDLAPVDWGSAAIREVIEPAYTPDVELWTLGSGVGTGLDAVYRGVDGLIRYLQEWLEPFSEYHLETLDFIEAGDHVLVPTRQRGIGDGSGAKVDLDVTLLYELRDGRIARLAQYDTLEQALEAVGLSE